MNTMDALLDLNYRIEAKYPLILVKSHEEGRFLRSMQTSMNQFSGVSGELGRQFYTWSLTEGMVLVEMTTTKGKKGQRDKIHMSQTNIEETDEITDVLAWIKKTAIKDAAEYAERRAESMKDRIARRKTTGHVSLPRRVYILKDTHPFMEIAPVRRYLRDLADILPTTAGTTVILLSPQMTLDPDIEKQVAVVDFPLPNEGEMEAFAREMVDENRKKLEAVPDGAEILKIARACLGLTYSETENVLAKSIAQHGKIKLQIISDEKKQIVEKSGVLKIIEPDISLDELGGMEDLKEEIAMMISESNDPEAAKWPLPPPRGILLGGPPGTGKTAIAKGIAKLKQVLCIGFSLSSCKGSHLGESEANFEAAIKVIDSNGDCVVLMDEAEKDMPASDAYQGDGGVGEGLLGQWLSWMQNSTSRKLVVMTCNDPRKLRPEAIRAGRIDTFWWNDLPSAEQRVKILALHLTKRKRPHSEVYDLGAVAEATDEYSGAELEQVVIKGLRIAFHKKRDLDTKHLLAGAKQIQPVAKTMKEKIETLREWAKTRARPTSSVKKKSKRTLQTSREL